MFMILIWLCCTKSRFCGFDVQFSDVPGVRLGVWIVLQLRLGQNRTRLDVAHFIRPRVRVCMKHKNITLSGNLLLDLAVHKKNEIHLTLTELLKLHIMHLSKLNNNG